MWPLLALSLSAGTATRAVSFDEILALSVRHPSVGAIRGALDLRMKGDAEISVLANNPILLATPGYRFTPDDQEGVEGSVSLSQPFSLGGAGAAKREAAAVERAGLRLELLAATLDRRLAAARLWLELRAAEQVATELLDAKRLAATYLAKVEKARGLGAATVVEVADARLFLGETMRLHLEAEGELVHASSALGRVAGLPPTLHLKTVGELPSPSLPDQSAWPTIIARHTDLPEVRQARLAAAAARAREAELAALASPELTAGLQWQRESPNSYIGFGLLGLSLPFFERNQRDRSAELAAARRAELEVNAGALDAGHELALALHEVEHARERLALYRETLLPAAAALVEAQERTYALGETTIFLLLEAQRRLVEMQRTAIVARSDAAWAEVKAWLLIAAAGDGS